MRLAVPLVDVPLVLFSVREVRANLSPIPTPTSSDTDAYRALHCAATARSIPMMVGSCAGLAALIGTFDAAGRSLSGTYAKASPLDYAAGDHAKDWREEREARRSKFFKVS